MAFPGSTIEDIYQDIKNRQGWVGRLSLVEFDDEEYEQLTRIGQRIVLSCDNWYSWLKDRQKQARVVFVAFACEYVRRNKYTNDNVFWQDFARELNIREDKYQNFIAYELLWQTYLTCKEVGIEPKTKKNRLIVRSLIDEVLNTSNTARNQFIDFFCWYYLHHIETNVTSQIIREYEISTKNSLSIFEKALPALNKDCRTLAKVVEFSTEQGHFLAHTNLDEYCRKIVELLGKEYDPRCLRLLRDKDMLRRLIVRLENHRTPIQFLRELMFDSMKIVKPPNSSRLYATIARRQLRPETMVYGLYKLGDIDYRVVPLSWLRLETIARWPYDEIISLRNGSYVGYKKQRPFSVKIGTRPVVEARQCYLQMRDQACYIWADKVPRGEPLRIDGRPYKGSAGLDWHPSLELSFDEDREPTVVIVFNWLKAYYPDKRGHRLFIRSSQGHEESKYTLNNEEGSCQLHRAFSFPLKRLGEPVTIWIDLAEKCIDSKTIEPETAYLFSASTRERIPNGTKREWGEQHYYLFASSKEVPKVGNGVKLEDLGTPLGNYVIYQVTWEETTSQFSLRVGDVSWCFEKQRYFYVRIKQQSAQGLVHLKGLQIRHFTQEQIQIWTNQKITSSSVTCSLLYLGEQVEIQAGFQHHNGDLYSFSGASIIRLNELTVNRACYGHFDLLFHEEGQLLGQMTVVVVPEIDVVLPSSDRPLLEGKRVPVKVSTPHLKIWDDTVGQKASSADFLLFPALAIQPWKDGVQVPRGILCLTPQVATIPVTFPAIGETVEIEIYPPVFGFRLYQRTSQQGSYRQVNILDYYTLKKSALYVHTKAHCVVTMYMNGMRVWIDRADEGGHILIEDLSFLNKYCHKEQTAINIRSEGVESTFFVHWNPLIHEMSVEKDRVCLNVSGPINTGIVLSLTDVNNNTLFQERVTCGGRHLTAYVYLPSAVSNGSQCYIMPRYYLSDRTLLPSAWQYRLEVPKSNSLPVDWLRAGVGISSEMLLQMSIVE